MTPCGSWILQLQQPAAPAPAGLLNDPSQWRRYRHDVWKCFYLAGSADLPFQLPDVSVHKCPPPLVKASNHSMRAKQQGMAISKIASGRQLQGG